MLLKFAVVLSIICGFLMAVLYLDPFTTMYCCCAVVSEDVIPEYPFNVHIVTF